MPKYFCESCTNDKDFTKINKRFLSSASLNASQRIGLRTLYQRLSSKTPYIKSGFYVCPKCNRVFAEKEVYTKENKIIKRLELNIM